MKSLLTFKQFPQKHPAFTEPALRNIRFHAEKNGFRDAFIQVGKRVLIDEDAFFECIKNQNQKVAA